MDTRTTTSGFSRSIVMKAGLAPKDVRAGAAGSPTAVTVSTSSVPAVDLAPTLVGTGIKLGSPSFAALPSAGSKTTLDIPFKIKDRKSLPKGLEASVRWDPIDVAFAPVAPDGNAAPTDAAAALPETPVGVITPSGVVTDAAAGEDDVQRLDAPADTSDLVVAEHVGDVVSPATVKASKKALCVPVALPTTPGKYRLTVVLHDADGVAYDADTQALIPSLIVRVTGKYDGDLQAAASADIASGADVELGVRVRTLGVAAWGTAAIKPTSNLSGYVPAKVAKLTARWIPLEG